MAKLHGEDSYNDLLHAMQTGVAAMMGKERINGEDPCLGEGDTSPKHLRVGINAAMCNHSALVELLIKKGIITSEEYVESATAVMKREVEDYERRLSTPDCKITLH
jgi:hypothetical protein